MAQGKTEIDVRSWIIRILKNWYWFLLSFVIFGALGTYKYITTTPKFCVDANVIINESQEALPEMDLMSVVGMGSSKKTIDEVEMLSSRDNIIQIIKELNLYTEYRKMDDFKWVGQYPSHDLTMVYTDSTFLDTIKNAVEVQIKVRKNDYHVRVKYGRWNRSRHTVKDITKPFKTCAGVLQFAINTPNEVEVGDKYKIITLPILPLVEKYRELIDIKPVDDESKVINIATTTDMPSRGRDFISKLIEVYNAKALADKNEMAQKTAKFIEDRLRLIEEELSAAEIEVERYKTENGVVSLPDEAELLVKESIEYSKRIAEIETQLNLVQFVNDFVTEDSKKNSLIPSNIGIVDESLVALITQYNELLLQRMRVQRTATDENPIISQMDAQLALLRDNIVMSINNVRSSLSISKRDVEDQYAVAQRQRDNMPIQERQYVEVERNRRLKEELYLFWEKRAEENALTLASVVEPIKIVAKPQLNPIPVGPKRKSIFLICLLLGFVMPLAIMIIYDFMNNKISDSSRDLEKRLNIPFAGVLVKNNRGEHVAVREGENSITAELFRTLRTNIRFMQPITEKCPVTLVTSSVNGEGKSYVATNLAISMALLGKKVALVGLDIRKPMLATYLNLPNQGCLTSYLSDSSCSIEDTIMPYTIENLDVIPAGVIPPNPGELLQSERIDELFEELRKRYDYVVIDSAPVAMVSDTFLLNRVTDMTIYVTRANYTTFDSLEFLNQSHVEQRLPRMVAVLNGVNAKKIRGAYGYGNV